MEFNEIVFSEETQWNIQRGTVIFYANVDGLRIQCSISRVALVDYYQTEDTKDQALNNFVENEDAIYDLVEKLIRADTFEEDGSIVIHLATCQKYNL